MTKRLNLLTTSAVVKSQNDSVAETLKFFKNPANITSPIEAKSNTFNFQSQNDSYLLKQHFYPGQLQIVSFQQPPFSPNEYVHKNRKNVAPKLKEGIYFKGFKWFKPMLDSRSGRE